MRDTAEATEFTEKKDKPRISLMTLIKKMNPAEARRRRGKIKQKWNPAIRPGYLAGPSASVGMTKKTADTVKLLVPAVIL